MIGKLKAVGHHLRALGPAAALALCAGALPAAVVLLPFGPTMLLARSVGADGAARAAEEAGAALVRVPAPGYVILYGDAARARHALGLVAEWKGAAACRNVQE